MGNSTTAPLAFVCGDPAGVGPEIIEAWLRTHPDAAKDVSVIGPSCWIEGLREFGCSVVAVGSGNYRVAPGVPDAEGSSIALQAMEVSAAGVASGRFSGVVTGPVSKSGLQKVGFQFPGQTEFFAARWGGVPSMAFTGGRLKVVLATWHLPLAQVPKAVTPEALELSVRSASELAKATGVSVPRIGVCGLNPHAGEDGVLGTEERDVIAPALDRLRGAFPGLSAPLSGDTVFSRALKGEFDVVIALYHDQGLAPLKTIDFDSAVNVTLGLPHVRTSPDHGTAYSLAGKGLASATSFENAVNVARLLINFRSGR